MNNLEEMKAALQKCKLDENELEAVSGGAFLSIPVGNGGNGCSFNMSIPDADCPFGSDSEFTEYHNCIGCPKYKVQ